MAEEEHKRILVICCEAEISALLGLLFDSGGEGYEVACAPCDVCEGDAASAIARVREHAPDLVIANRPAHPGPDCGRIVAALAAEPTTREIPVILIEDRLLSYLVARMPIGQQPNVVAVYDKPFDVNDLADRVKEILRTPRAD